MTEQQNPCIDVTIPDEDAGVRMDKVVAKLANISNNKARELLDAGKVKAGKYLPKKGDKARAGALLRIELPLPEQPVAQADLELNVLHFDDAILAIDKVHGMAMHPLIPNETGTLANGVLARFPDVLGASPEERCPGLLHRLDTDTSGVVLWARTPHAFAHVRAQFAAKTVVKKYYALIDGFVEGQGELNVALAHDPDNAKKMIATPYPAEAEEYKARPAITKYKVLADSDEMSLVEVEIPTGVMHQIRAHFAFVGYPIVGDLLYGSHVVAKRHLLHASSIQIIHPTTLKPVVYHSALPTDFLEQLQKVGIQPPVRSPNAFVCLSEDV